MTLPTLTGSQLIRPISARSRVRVESSVVGEVIGNLGVGGREGPAPSLEVVEVDPIGSPRRGGNADLDVTLDLAGRRGFVQLPARQLVRGGASGLTTIACWVAESSIVGRDKRVLSRVRTRLSVIVPPPRGGLLQSTPSGSPQCANELTVSDAKRKFRRSVEVSPTSPVCRRAKQASSTPLSNHCCVVRRSAKWRRRSRRCSDARMFSGRMIFRAESPAICAAGAGIAKKAGDAPVL